MPLRIEDYALIGDTQTAALVVQRRRARPPRRPDGGCVMRAITLQPGVKDSAALEEVPEPRAEEGAMLVDGVALGICGTDAEIVRGDYGEAPPGAERLVLGHESLGRVAEAPDGSGFAPGDLVVGIVRRPDPVPCPSCAAGEWDFCRNGRLHRARHQGAARLRLRALADRAGVRDQARSGARHARRADGADDRRREGLGADRPRAHARDARARARARHRRRPDRAARGAARAPARLRADGARSRQRADRSPSSCATLGGTYHSGPLTEVDPPPDIIVEATGASQVVLDAMSHTRANGIVCLTGISSGGHEIGLDAGDLNRRDRAGERPRLRLGQRQPAPLRGGGARRSRRPTTPGWSA